MSDIRKINTNVKDSNVSILSRREMIDLFNADEGDLNKEDGINCPICKNKGYIYVIDKDDYECVKPCSCMIKRNVFKRLIMSNINKEVLEHYTFENFKTSNLWQKELKNKVMEYTKNIINGDKSWLFLSGISGCGKSMLCTACFQEIIKNTTYTGEYILWNSFITRLIPMSKSVFEDIAKKYEETINRITNVDILYIDDLLKLSNITNYNTDALSLLYRIINYRYINNKITIMSSELYPKDIVELDTAIAGRINEKCNFNEWWVTIKNEPNRNYRFKKED